MFREIRTSEKITDRCVTNGRGRVDITKRIKPCTQKEYEDACDFRNRIFNPDKCIDITKRI